MFLPLADVLVADRAVLVVEAQEACHAHDIVPLHRAEVLALGRRLAAAPEPTVRAQTGRRPPPNVVSAAASFDLQDGGVRPDKCVQG